MQLLRRMQELMIRLLQALWALPGTLIGLLLILPYWPNGMRIINGALWVKCNRIFPAMAIAQTWGNVVFWEASIANTPPRFLELHETEHVRQWGRWGALFIPAYLLASAWAWLRWGEAYQCNVFEISARIAEYRTVTKSDAG
jgi:hypothetical protein